MVAVNDGILPPRCAVRRREAVRHRPRGLQIWIEEYLEIKYVLLAASEPASAPMTKTLVRPLATAVTALATSCACVLPTAAAGLMNWPDLLNRPTPQATEPDRLWAGRATVADLWMPRAPAVTRW